MSARRGTRRRNRGVRAIRILAVAMGLIGPGCWRGEPEEATDPSKLTIALRCPAFGEGAMIPGEFSCDGPGGSPPLEWSGVPPGAKELALIVDDPDAPVGTFSHWVVVNLPPDCKGVTAGVPAAPVVPGASIVTASREPNSAAHQGKNDFGKVGYGGPCPPSGVHRYVFRLYALDVPVQLAAESVTRPTVLEAIKGHILAEGRLIGRYARSK